MKDFYFFPAREASTNPISSLRPRSDNYVASASYSSSVYSEENAGKWGQLEDRGGSGWKEGTTPKKEKEIVNEREKESERARGEKGEKEGRTGVILTGLRESFLKLVDRENRWV